MEKDGENTDNPTEGKLLQRHPCGAADTSTTGGHSRQLPSKHCLVATGNFSVPYTKALFAATHTDMLVEPDKQDYQEPHAGTNHKDGKKRNGDFTA